MEEKPEDPLDPEQIMQEILKKLGFRGDPKQSVKKYASELAVCAVFDLLNAIWRNQELIQKTLKSPPPEELGISGLYQVLVKAEAVRLASEVFRKACVMTGEEEDKDL